TPIGSVRFGVGTQLRYPRTERPPRQRFCQHARARVSLGSRRCAVEREVGPAAGDLACELITMARAHLTSSQNACSWDILLPVRGVSSRAVQVMRERCSLVAGVDAAAC